mmetsp:Transcript_15309/g.23263  ORF Transcript_15309/g.23263 Transcript_15309/m.23263 type:complete len:207 (-) Transcript_15309:626-1246(-)
MISARWWRLHQLVSVLIQQIFNMSEMIAERVIRRLRQKRRFIEQRSMLPLDLFLLLILLDILLLVAVVIIARQSIRNHLQVKRLRLHRYRTFGCTNKIHNGKHRVLRLMSAQDSTILIGRRQLRLNRMQSRRRIFFKRREFQFLHLDLGVNSNICIVHIIHIVRVQQIINVILVIQLVFLLQQSVVILEQCSELMPTLLVIIFQTD